MKIYLYKGGFSIVRKSGVGSAIRHQEQMLKETGALVTDQWREADVVHINTVFPDSFLRRIWRRNRGRKSYTTDTLPWKTSVIPLSDRIWQGLYLKGGSADVTGWEMQY